MVPHLVAIAAHPPPRQDGPPGVQRQHRIHLVLLSAHSTGIRFARSNRAATELLTTGTYGSTADAIPYDAMNAMVSGIGEG